MPGHLFGSLESRILILKRRAYIHALRHGDMPCHCRGVPAHPSRERHKEGSAGREEVWVELRCNASVDLGGFFSEMGVYVELAEFAGSASPAAVPSAPMRASGFTCDDGFNGGIGLDSYSIWSMQATNT